MNAQEIESQLSLGQLDLLKAAEPSSITILIDFAGSQNIQIARRARLVLGQLKRTDSIEALISHTVFSGDELTLSICLAAQYDPDDVSKRAILYCMGEEWDLLYGMTAYAALIARGISLTSQETRKSVLAKIVNGCERVSEVVLKIINSGEQIIIADLVSVLAGIKNQDLVDKISLEWVKTRNPTIGIFLRDLTWIASSPLEAKILTVLNSGNIIEIASPTTAELAALLKCIRDEDSVIHTNAALVFKSLTDSEAIDELCRLAARADDKTALQIVQKFKYQPSEAKELAIFHLLLGDWELYSKIDFDRSLLISAYAQEPEDIQARIFEQLKRSGHTDWLRSVVASKERRNLVDITATEWNAIVEGLTVEEQWEEMWRLARIAPVRVCAALIRTLRTVAWEPEQTAYTEVFKELSSLAVKCIESNTLQFQFTKFKQPLVSSVYALAFQADGSQLFLGDSNGQVTSYSPKESTMAHGPRHKNMVNAIAVNSTGTIVISGSNDSTIQLWMPNKKKDWKATNSWVKAVDINSSNSLALTAAGSDISIWNINEKPEVILEESRRLRDCKAEITAARFSLNSRYVFACSVSHRLYIWDLSSPKKFDSYDLPDYPIGLAVEQDWVAIADERKKLSIFHLTKRGITRTIQLPSDICCCIAVHGHVFCGLFDGTVAIVNPIDGTIKTVLKAHSVNVTALAYNEAQNCLATSGADGMKLWTDESRDLLAKPAKYLSVNVTADFTDASSPWLNFAEALAKSQNLFDVDLADGVTEISVGEFDIELLDL